MDSFNKVLSFVLGLVVVLVFFSVVTGKLKLPGNKTATFSFFKKNITPTPVSSIKIDDKTTGVLEEKSPANNYENQTLTKTPIRQPVSIPATGLPTMFFPSLLAGVAGGIFLRRFSKPGHF